MKRSLIAVTIAILVVALTSSRADDRFCYRTTDPAPLNTNAYTGDRDDDEPHVATDSLGNWLAVWASKDRLDDTIGGDQDILVSRSTDSGAIWSDPIPVNTNAGTDSGDDRVPRIATDGLGNWIVVWESRDDLDWTIGTDWDILVSLSIDNGATWSQPQALNTNAAADGRDDRDAWIGTDGFGNWVAIWTSDNDLGGTIGTDGDLFIAKSNDNGATWSAPRALNTNADTDSGDDLEPHLATDTLRNWVVVWSSDDDLGDSIGTDRDILVSRSADDGDTWSDPEPLNSQADTDGHDDWRPRVATDTEGHWVTTWTSEENLGGTIGFDSDILVSRSVDNGATWSDVVSLNSNAGTDGGADDEAPHVTTDTIGNWVTVWQTADDLDGAIGSDLDVLVSRSTDDGATWTVAEPLNTNAASGGGDDEEPVIAVDSSGDWVAVWSSRDDLQGTIGGNLDIFVVSFGCRDCDLDGFGSPAHSSCPGGIPEDCDDDDGTVSPGAAQVCDGLNNDCDHPSWPDLEGTSEYDDDGDTFAECAGDCDDSAATVFPAAPQDCDGVNNDCNHPAWPSPAGTNDGDDDGDGLSECSGDCDDAKPFCTSDCTDSDTDGHCVTTDCDDTHGTVYPGAPQICDGLNNDCSHPSWPGVGDTNDADDDGDGLAECTGDCNDANPNCAADCADADGDGYCVPIDCDDAKSTRYPGAIEINNGLDEQCAGHEGHGLIDEISGESGFVNLANDDEYSWPAQQGATAYQVARCGQRDFLSGCVTFDTVQPYLADAEQPPSGGVFYYVVRPISVHSGSWGHDSEGQERVFACPTEVCSDGVDNDSDGLTDCLDWNCCIDPICDGAGYCEYETEVSCVDGLDNDGDGFSDCTDPDCDGETDCEYGSEATCADWLDNDADGLIDCSDPDCNGRDQCEFGDELTCWDFFDNDEDGLRDCQDPDCFGQPSGCDTESYLPWYCSDGLDNDSDGSPDCLDGDCHGIENCEYVSELTCSDAFDNDADGLTDCQDVDCNGIDECEYGVEISCHDNVDNDGDGLIDCQEINCDGNGFCQHGFELTCEDGLDNDRDYLTDCLDPDCYGQAPHCSSEAGYCSDGGDNDADGLTDCLDLDCDGHDDCEHGNEMSCDDSFDNDADGLTDCSDPDCYGRGGCSHEVGYCSDDADNDEDGLIDCLDPDCDGHNDCEHGNEVSCSDSVDNDADGAIDCQDSDCHFRDNCEPYEGNCDDAFDNDGNGATDCQDSLCDWFPACEQDLELTCDDSFDNDGDELIDCQDPDCDGFPTCELGIELTCDDALDNDGDGLLDCFDPNCFGQAPFCTNESAFCADGGDNDSDGLTDCQDPDCHLEDGCTFGAELNCSDAFDNDGDGPIDCLDADCFGLQGCLEETGHCFDGYDNDADGLTDCQDPDCEEIEGCTELICDDSLDNDGDGPIDCLDADCFGRLGCTNESGYCFDTRDNDADGLTDCSDPDCFGQPGCLDEVGRCADGYDNDGDGFVDCQDPDCDGSDDCEYGGEETCTDQIDNDGDGPTDCCDSDCLDDPACPPGSCPTDDAFVDVRLPNLNRGAMPLVLVRNGDGSGSGRWDLDTLVKFDLSAIPAGATVTSATLRLYFYLWQDSDPTGRPLRCYRLTEAWNEDTVTWSNRPDHVSTVPSEATVPASHRWISWDVKQDVQQFVANPTDNHGWIIRDETDWGAAGIPFIRFRSKEDGAHTPHVVISWTAGGSE